MDVLSGICIPGTETADLAKSILPLQTSLVCHQEVQVIAVCQCM